MTVVLVVAAVSAVVGTVVLLVSLLWAAREDGRDQRRRDAGR